MITSWISERNAGRPGRVGPVLGLLVVLVLHLAGAVHGASFEGPHMSNAAGVCSSPTVDDGRRIAPHPGHDHRAEGHIDHAADRPRTVSVDDTLPGPAQGVLVLIPPAAPAFAGPGEPRAPPGATHAPYGRSLIALHCVRRQ